MCPGAEMDRCCALVSPQELLMSSTPYHSTLFLETIIVSSKEKNKMRRK